MPRRQAFQRRRYQTQSGYKRWYYTPREDRYCAGPCQRVDVDLSDCSAKAQNTFSRTRLCPLCADTELMDPPRAATSNDDDDNNVPDVDLAQEERKRRAAVRRALPRMRKRARTWKPIYRVQGYGRGEYVGTTNVSDSLQTALFTDDANNDVGGGDDAGDADNNGRETGGGENGNDDDDDNEENDNNDGDDDDDDDENNERENDYGRTSDDEGGLHIDDDADDADDNGADENDNDPDRRQDDDVDLDSFPTIEGIGRCCMCDEPCNPASQACGRCARDMTMRALGWIRTERDVRV